MPVLIHHPKIFLTEIYFRYKKTTGPDRLVIAPNENHIAVLLALAELWDDEYFLLYILLIPRNATHVPGRYQSPDLLSFNDVKEFCLKFRSFLETDGRHHFWIGSVNDRGTLVYDHHNVIYAYGDLVRYVELLKQRGFKEGDIRFPAPHTHGYHLENDRFESEIIDYWQWVRSPLQPGDDY